jgi:ubiquitin C-terminal hydrolase
MSSGFTNLGNTCYMNSALQCISHLPYLSVNNNDFMDNYTKYFNGDNKLIDEWINIQTLMWKNPSENLVINTSPLLKEFIKTCRQKKIYFESFQQNDSADFITIFIDLLHDSIKRKVSIQAVGEAKTQYDKLKIKSIQSWGNFFDSGYSYIIKQCYSQLLSLTSCPKCDYITTNHEPIMVISLTMKNNYNTLYDCLDEYVKETVLDTNNTWKCDKCSENVCPHKKTNFWDLSPVLIFQIKQYRRGLKLNKHIDFPETLSMGKYCLRNKKETNYKLSSISIHSGGLNGGHYYAMCKNNVTNEWNIHNDTSVRKINIERVLSETPYCLFYHLA